MAETLTMESNVEKTSIDSLSAEEQDSLKVGEQMQEAQDNLLAGKYKSAQELEQGYLELQKKLGQTEQTEEAPEAQQEQPEEEEDQGDEEEEGYDYDYNEGYYQENGEEERRFGCSRFFIELGGECFEGPGRAHVSYEWKPMRVFVSEIAERAGGFAIISEYLGEEEGRMYSRVEYLCEAQTAFVREGIDGYKDEEDKFVLPYNAFLMDDDVKIGSGEKRYLHYQSIDTSWYNGNKFE